MEMNTQTPEIAWKTMHSVSLDSLSAGMFEILKRSCSIHTRNLQKKFRKSVWLIPNTFLRISRRQVCKEFLGLSGLVGSVPVAEVSPKVLLVMLLGLGATKTWNECVKCNGLISSRFIVLFIEKSLLKDLLLHNEKFYPNNFILGCCRSMQNFAHT